MLHRTLILIVFLLLVLPACSNQDAKKPGLSGEALLKPDTGLVILLRDEPDSNITPTDDDIHELTLIAGGAVEHFTGIQNPAISRNGNLIGQTEDGKTVIRFFDGGEHTFKSTILDTVIPANSGFGISPSGKKAYRIGMEFTEDKDALPVFLYEFNNEKKRPGDKRILMQMNPLDFESDKQNMADGLSSPLIAAEKGTSVFYRKAKPLSKAKEYDYHRIDLNSGDSELWLEYDTGQYSDIHLLDCSYDGNSSLHSAVTTNGELELMVKTNPDDPPKTIIEYKPGGIMHPRLSPEGSRVGLFRKADGGTGNIIEAVIVSVISTRQDVRLMLHDAHDFYWSDDLNYVAYVSNSFRTSVIESGKTRTIQPGEQWYLHLVEIDGFNDSVIYSSGKPEPFSILDILLESEEMKDKSKLKPRVTAPGEEGTDGGSSYSNRGEGEGFDPESGPSISAK